jgi:hypothetical protein
MRIEAQTKIKKGFNSENIDHVIHRSGSKPPVSVFPQGGSFSLD